LRVGIYPPGELGRREEIFPVNPPRVAEGLTVPHQVAVFVENKPGKLEKITGLLAARRINLRAITIADNGDFGVMKILADDPEKARAALVEAGLAAALKDVVAIVLPDRPGALHEFSSVLTRHRINIEDAYGFVLARGQKAVFVIEVDNPAETETLLRKEGLALLTDKDLYAL